MIYQILFVLIPFLYFLYYYHRFPAESQGSVIKNFKSFFHINPVTFDCVKKGIYLFVILFAVFLLLGIVYSLFNQGQGDVVGNYILDSYNSLGFIFLLIVLFGVIIEEFFFRAFLVERFGILISTIAFALMHQTYGSWFELIGAFILGLIIAIWWSKYKDFWQVVFAHLLYNSVIILLVIL